MQFSLPVTHTYNPLNYARLPHEQYLNQWGAGKKRVLFLGMNPGPFGMAQTGVPFGEVGLVRDFLRVNAKVKKPAVEHPKRPILGFACPRSEVSGARLWGYFRTKFRTPERFFEHHFVINYCPLVFMEASGKNRTPDKLPSAERQLLYDACDLAMQRLVEEFAPEWVVGVGAFAEKRARQILGESAVRIASILHPSPASPKANRGWSEFADQQLSALGLA
jgi:single-strand selective monofunctional uracil DNA glycosylase